MADHRGFLKVRRARAAAEPSRPRPAAWTGRRCTSTALENPDAELVVRRQAGRCMDCGIPFCHQGCPLGNLIPDWNDLTRARAVGRRDRAPARHEQLPGVHRPHLPRAVRVVLRARHQPGPGDDQERRGDDRRGGVRARPGHPAGARRGSPAARSPSSARGRPDSPPPSSSPGPGTPSRCTSATTPSAASCATACRTSSSRSRHRPPDRADGRRGHPVPPRRRRSAGTSRWPQLRARYDAVVVATGATVPRDLPLPGRDAGRHPPRDGLPAPGQRGRRRPRGPPTRSSRPASTSSSSAAATPARTASAPRCGRARRSVTTLAIGKQPPTERPRAPAVADRPHRCSRSRARTRRAASATTSRRPSRSRAPTAGSPACAWRPRSTCPTGAASPAVRHGAGHPGRPRARRHGLHGRRGRRPRPRRPTSSVTPRGVVARVGRLRDEPARRVRGRRRRPRPVAHRLGDRRGPCRGGRRRRLPLRRTQRAADADQREHRSRCTRSPAVVAGSRLGPDPAPARAPRTPT